MSVRALSPAAPLRVVHDASPVLVRAGEARSAGPAGTDGDRSGPTTGTPPAPPPAPLPAAPAPRGRARRATLVLLALVGAAAAVVLGLLGAVQGHDGLSGAGSVMAVGAGASVLAWLGMSRAQG